MVALSPKLDPSAPAAICRKRRRRIAMTECLLGRSESMGRQACRFNAPNVLRFSCDGDHVWSHRAGPLSRLRPLQAPVRLGLALLTKGSQSGRLSASTAQIDVEIGP